MTGDLEDHKYMQGFAHDHGKVPADLETLWRKEGSKD